jgi:hypothetical protein
MTSGLEATVMKGMIDPIPMISMIAMIIDPIITRMSFLLSAGDKRKMTFLILSSLFFAGTSHAPDPEKRTHEGVLNHACRMDYEHTREVQLKPFPPRLYD